MIMIRKYWLVGTLLLILALLPFSSAVMTFEIPQSAPPSGSNVTTFLELTDVFETTYTGAAGQVPQVNANETGLEFVDLPGIPVAFGTRSYTLRVVNWGGGQLYYTGNNIPFSSTKGYRMPRDGYITSVAQELDVSAFTGVGISVTSQVRINNAVALSTSVSLSSPGFYTSSNTANVGVVTFNQGDLLQVSSSHNGGLQTVSFFGSANVEVVFT